MNDGKPVDKETRNLLIDAELEIKRIRQRNEVLEAQMHVVNVFAAALLGPPRQQGASVDVCWQLRQAIDLSFAAEKHEQS